MVVDLLKKDVYNFYCISSRIEKTGQFYGRFKIGPLQQSLTLANALRRTLLTDQSKCVINAIQIYGVEHEFSSLMGVRESVLDLLLNLEKFVFQVQKPITKPCVAFVHFSGPGILRGKHLHLPPGVQCTDPSQYIATLEVDGQLTFKLFFGFSHDKQNQQKDFLFLKSCLCAVVKANYTLLQDTKNNEEFVLFEVWTDGSLHPKVAMSKAINKLLLDVFFGFVRRDVVFSTRVQRKKITNFSKRNFREQFFNLEIGNFSFDLETFLFFKKKKIYRIIDLLSFLKEKDLENWPKASLFRSFLLNNL